MENDPDLFIYFADRQDTFPEMKVLTHTPIVYGKAKIHIVY